MSIINVVLLTPLTCPLHTHTYTQACSMVTWQAGVGRAKGEDWRVQVGAPGKP